HRADLPGDGLEGFRPARIDDLPQRTLCHDRTLLPASAGRRPPQRPARGAPRPQPQAWSMCHGRRSRGGNASSTPSRGAAGERLGGMGVSRFSCKVFAIRWAGSSTEYCRTAERYGYDAVFTADHLGSPAPFSPLIAAAEATQRVRVGTMVLNIGFWNPHLL